MGCLKRCSVWVEAARAHESGNGLQNYLKQNVTSN
jgi:hypothetical protein